MSVKNLTPQALKRIISEEKQKLLRENAKKRSSSRIEKEYQLLMLLELADRRSKGSSAKLRKVKNILKQRILKRS